MRHKLVMVVLAVTIPAGVLVATQTMASAGRSHGSTVNATGSVACTTAVGTIRLNPGWKTNSNTLPAPSKVIFNITFGNCAATHPGNVTTRSFSGHLKGSVNFPSNDCTSNFGGAVALTGSPVPIAWSKAARIGPVIPAPTNVALTTVTGSFTAGVGIKFVFTNRTITGSFSTKTLSGELDSALDACSPNNGIHNIPVTSGKITQP